MVEIGIDRHKPFLICYNMLSKFAVECVRFFCERCVATDSAPPIRSVQKSPTSDSGISYVIRPSKYRGP